MNPEKQNRSRYRRPPPPTDSLDPSIAVQSEQEKLARHNATKNECSKNEDGLPSANIRPLINNRTTEGLFPPENETSGAIIKKEGRSRWFGRINVKVKQGLNINPPDCLVTGFSKRTIKPFFRYTLFQINSQYQEECPTPKNSKQILRQTSLLGSYGVNPNFEENGKAEIVTFDVGESFYSASCPKKKAEGECTVMLTIDMFDKIHLKEKIIGTSQLHINQLFPSELDYEHFILGGSKRYENLWLPLALTTPGSTNNTNAHNGHESRIKLFIHLEPATVGMIIVETIMGTNIGPGADKVNCDMENQNSFVTLESLKDNHESSESSEKSLYNKRFMRGNTVIGGGRNPYFDKEELIMWLDENNYFQDICLRVFNESKYGDLISELGNAKLSALPYMLLDVNDSIEEHVVLSSPSGTEKAGELVVKIKFLDAGELRVLVKGAQDLCPVFQGKIDPYIQVSTEGGHASTVTKRTNVDNGGNVTPLWNEVLLLHVVDHYGLIIECFHHDTITCKDTIIGQAKLDLTEVFKKGKFESWIKLERINKNKVMRESGKVHISMTFIGRKGIAFPQRQPEVQSFDERWRIENFKEQDNKKASSIVFAQDLVRLRREPDIKQPLCPFTDDDIKIAFNVLDLDKNGFLGAKEIKHVLICMGEIVTDEEVDTMITMLDSQGNGQVNLREFRMMVKDPDPSRQEFSTSFNHECLMTTGKGAADLAERKRRRSERKKKRSILQKFLSKHKIETKEIEKAWKEYQRYKFGKKIVYNEPISFVLFCKLLSVDPTGETRDAFELFDEDGSGTVEISELILVLISLVDMCLKDKCSFIFDLFDEDRSGYLSKDEIEAILSANYMEPRSAMKNKANLILQSVGKDITEITVDELLGCAEKFPNIMFPKLDS